MVFCKEDDQAVGSSIRFGCTGLKAWKDGMEIFFHCWAAVVFGEVAWRLAKC